MLHLTLLAPTSPLIVEGDPGLSDTDGSHSDIGMYGGADAPTWDHDDEGQRRGEALSWFLLAKLCWSRRTRSRNVSRR